MKKKTYIYGLFEENTKKIRYVGKSDNPKIRRRAHINRSFDKKTHLDCWIQSILKKGKTIDFMILETVPYKNWPEKEQHWIEKLKGNKLVNHAQGGKGGRPIVYKISYRKCKQWANKNLHFIKSQTQWYNYVENNKIPDFITHFPANTYANRGWVSWSVFLNTNNKCYNYIDYLNYEKAKEYVQNKLKFIKTTKEWKEYLKNNDLSIKRIPRQPQKYYKDKGWTVWKDFLGNKRKNELYSNYFTYEEAKIFIKNNLMHINSANLWRENAKSKLIPERIPNKPDRYYKKTGDWISWGDFLGTGVMAPNKIIFLDFKEAKKYIHKLKIKNNKEWRQYCNFGTKPKSIPFNPPVTYKNDWIDWYDWLGKER